MFFNKILISLYELALITPASTSIRPESKNRLKCLNQIKSIYAYKMYHIKT